MVKVNITYKYKCKCDNCGKELELSTLSAGSTQELSKRGWVTNWLTNEDYCDECVRSVRNDKVRE